jgi:hypothetical protein
MSLKTKGKNFELLGLHNVSDPEFIKIITTTDGGCPDVTTKIILPGAHISRSHQHPTGLVYIMDPSHNAYEILKHIKDLCGGVSLYDIQNIPVNIEFLTKSMGALFTQLPHSVADFSLFETRNALREGDLQSSYINGLKLARVLGEENCSISIVRSIDEDQVEHFHMIIKSYDPISVKRLLDSIEEDKSLTMSQIIASPLYKAAIVQGNIKRNAIAWFLANALDCGMVNANVTERLTNAELEYTDEEDNQDMININTITPTVEQHYNIISQLTYQGRQRIAFYNGCFNIGEDRAVGVLLGLGRDVGYQYYWNSEKRATRFGSEEYASAFPMGVPQQPQHQNVINRAIKAAIDILDRRVVNNDTPKDRQFAITSHTPGHVVWSGPFDFNVKNIANSYDAVFAKNARSLIYSLLSVERLETCKMVTQGCYISSPIEENLSILDIVQLRLRSSKKVRVLQESEFMKNHFMPCYHKYRRRMIAEQKKHHAPINQIPKLSGIILDEDDYFFYIDANILEVIVDELML